METAELVCSSCNATLLYLFGLELGKERDIQPMFLTDSEADYCIT